MVWSEEDITRWAKRECPKTCEYDWHVSHGYTTKKCDCGMTRNPGYRSWWQRAKDRIKFRRRSK